MYKIKNKNFGQTEMMTLESLLFGTHWDNIGIHVLRPPMQWYATNVGTMIGQHHQNKHALD